MIVLFCVVLFGCFVVDLIHPHKKESVAQRALHECTAMEIGKDSTGGMWKDYYCPGDSTVRLGADGSITRRP